MSQEQWSVLKILKWTEGFFERKEIPDARLNAERLLAHLLGYSRIELYTNFEQPLQKSELDEFRSMIERRVKHEPLQYIIGEVPFLDLIIKCDKRALIPRPETEYMVDEIIKRFKDNPPARILDIGTGTGCIALSLAKAFPEAEVMAVDVSDDVLDLAQENQTHNNIENIVFQKSDLFGNLEKTKYDLIVSNPPYVSTEDYNNLDLCVKGHEPKSALESGKDGLDTIRLIVEQAGDWMSKGGFLFFEMGYDQSDTVRKLIEESSLSLVEIIKDYSQIDRIVVAGI